jgi:hypothetical protein
VGSQRANDRAARGLKIARSRAAIRECISAKFCDVLRR